jgi:murein DD-endopeptidase MepM/ murein hydrolase activator NlpD
LNFPTPPAARRGAALVLIALTFGPAPWASASGKAATSASKSEPAFPSDPPLARSPLAPPLVFKAGFGDYRGGHFHAGFDLGTGQRVGAPVRAPGTGWVERARTSGVGYGRSLYLRLLDGRILQFGHLDAFARPLDRFVRHAQDSTGEYEQDLWLPRDRVPVKAGETIAWTGESGAGGPHLHVEIRRGDVAYNPLRAGLPARDRLRPLIPTLTLEPLDDRSQVNGRPGPVTIALTGADTVRAIGRLRAVVGARARSKGGAGGMAPWEVGMEWNGGRTACRFDSVSWAADMPEAEYVYDAGRVAGGKGFVLWAPPGFRPRALRSDAPEGEEAGTIEIRSGDPPRALRLWAREVNGASFSRRVVLRPEAPPAEATAGWWRGADAWDDASVEFTSLPGGYFRVSVPAPGGAKGLEIQLGDRARRAARAGERWCALFAPPESADASAARVPLAYREVEGSGSPRSKAGTLLIRRAKPSAAVEWTDAAGRMSVAVPKGALFEESTLLSFAAGTPPSSESRELVAMSGAWVVGPGRLPLRKPVTIRLTVSGDGSLARVGLYRFDAGRWSYVGGVPDSTARTVRGAATQLGRFALFRDEAAPRVSLVPPAAPPAAAGPYSRWSVEASVIESESGLDPRASWLEVDGARVPTEWDPEAGRLRWRPVAPLAPGAHDAVIVASDRAGNEARLPARFRVGP